MNYIYGYPLFDKEDLAQAFNYLNYNEPRKTIDPKDFASFKEDLEGDNGALALVLVANTKLVNNITAELCKKLRDFLETTQYTFGFVVINPEVVMRARNPFVDKLVNKVSDYFAKNFYSLPSTSIYFDRIQNTRLEQIIKLKYSEYCIEDGMRLYVRLTPQENFKFILDFIEDVFRYS